MANYDIPEAKKEFQAAALLAALKEHGPLTTSDGRDHLGIFHMAGRIGELRASGHRILTSLVWANDEQGRPHKQALYSLMTEAPNHD